MLAQLSPWLQQTDRLHLEGDEVMLPSIASLTIGMALHELATDAATYGALSNPQGEVAGSWR